MSELWIVVIAVVVIAAVVYLGFIRTRERGSIRDEQQDRAQSRAEHVDQREDRRRAGMTTEDKAWEEASQQRDREAQARPRSTDDNPD